MNKRNLGRFELPFKMLDNEPERAEEIFRLLKAVPVEAYAHLYQSAVKYIAISERFREVAKGEDVPRYRLILTQGEDGSIDTVEAVEID